MICPRIPGPVARRQKLWGAAEQVVAGFSQQDRTGCGPANGEDALPLGWQYQEQGQTLNIHFCESDSGVMPLVRQGKVNI